MSQGDHTNEEKRSRANRIGLPGLAALVLAGLVSCASVSGGSVKGRAVDADTGKPLAHAVAYGLWEGPRAAITRSDGIRAWADSALLDARGAFRIPGWRTWAATALMTSGVERTVVVYAPGYELAILAQGDPLDVRLRRFVGTVDDRFGQLGVPSCPVADTAHRLGPVDRMMADEMAQLATTDTQRQRAGWIAENAQAQAGRPADGAQ